MAAGMSGAAPVAASPAGMAIPLTDLADGKLTIDLAALFASTPQGAEPMIGSGVSPDPMMGAADPGMLPPTAAAPLPTDDPMAGLDAVAGGATPPPVAPATGAPPPADDQGPPVDYNTFKESVESFGRKLNESKKTGKLSTLVNNAFESKLFDMFGHLQTMQSNKSVSLENYKLLESRLEALYGSLKETSKEPTSYDKTAQREQKMKSLKEFAQALFESDASNGSASAKGSAGFGDGGKAPQKNTDEGKDDATVKSSGDHAQKASESRPVADPGKAESHDVDRITESDDMNALEEQLREMFGDDSSDDEDVTTEGSDAAKVVVNKGAAQMDALPGGKGGNKQGAGPAVIEVAEKELKEAALKNKKKELARKAQSLKEEHARLVKALKECGMDGMASEMGTIELRADTVNINVDGASLGGGATTGDMGLAGAVDDDVDSGSDFGAGDDDDIVVVDDDGDSDDSGDFGGSDLPSKEEDDGMPKEGRKPASKKLVAENKQLKEHISQMELLTARSLYLNKLMTREELSRDQKRKIVEYLDTANNLVEAKAIFNRVKRILDEAKSNDRGGQRTSKSGSSSAPAKSGSVVTESVEQPTVSGGYGSTRERFMALAGIRPKSN